MSAFIQLFIKNKFISNHIVPNFLVEILCIPWSVKYKETGLFGKIISILAKFVAETRLDRYEQILVVLSYILIVLTFPMSMFICLHTATVFQRIVIFRLGKLRKDGIFGPGLVFILPCIDKCIKVDLRTRSFNVNPQEIITMDSVSIKVDAVVYYCIRNPLDAVAKIENVRSSTRLLAQATLRTVVGTHDLMELLTSKESISKTIEEILDEATGNWGIKVERVEIKQIHLPKNMQRAMAVEQEAVREAQAKIVAANGELNASANLKAASDIMKSNPVSLQLRYLQTLSTISSENNHTIIFPFPLDVVRRIVNMLQSKNNLKNDKDNKNIETKPDKIDEEV